MGAFGTSSDANDTSWDVLGHCCPNPEREESSFPINQAEADALVAWIASGFPGGDKDEQRYWAARDESETILGPVIWLLGEGFTVDAAMLKRALAVARAKRSDKVYLSCWTDREERDTALAEEIVILRRALKVLAPL